MTVDTIALLEIYQIDRFAMHQVIGHHGYLFHPKLFLQQGLGSSSC